jgi:hypothetical protein
MLRLALPIGGVPVSLVSAALLRNSRFLPREAPVAWAG